MNDQIENLTNLLILIKNKKDKVNKFKTKIHKKILVKQCCKNKSYKLEYKKKMRLFNKSLNNQWANNHKKI